MPRSSSARKWPKILTGWSGYTTLLVQVPQYSEQTAQAAADQLKGTLEKMNTPVVFYRTFDPNKHFLQDMVNGVIMITTVMGVLALGLGLFLVVNTINALVAQQIPQIGIMKAIGGTTRQVMTLYMVSVLIYGLLALIIALPLGVLAADAVAEALLKMMGIAADPNVNASTSAVIQQVTVALLVPLLAALWPIYSGVRLTVREATSNYGIGATFGKGLIDRMLAKVRGLPRQAILTIRNTFRRKGRVVLTQITLIMAGVVFVMVMSSAASFTYTINYLTDSLGLKVLMNFEQPVRIDEAKAIIESQPDVEFAEFTLFQSTTAYKDKESAEGKDIFINAVLPDSRLLKLAVVNGRWLLPEDEHAVVLTTDVAGKMGVAVGDKIFLKIDGTDRMEWTVVGTVNDLSSGAAQHLCAAGRVSARSGIERARHHRVVVDHARYTGHPTPRGKEPARRIECARPESGRHADRRSHPREQREHLRHHHDHAVDDVGPHRLRRRDRVGGHAVHQRAGAAARNRRDARHRGFVIPDRPAVCGRRVDPRLDGMGHRDSVERAGGAVVLTGHRAGHQLWCRLSVLVDGGRAVADHRRGVVHSGRGAASLARDPHQHSRESGVRIARLTTSKTGSIL